MRGGFVVESPQHTGASCFFKVQPYPELTLCLSWRICPHGWPGQPWRPGAGAPRPVRVPPRLRGGEAMATPRAHGLTTTKASAIGGRMSRSLWKRMAQGRPHAPISTTPPRAPQRASPSPLRNRPRLPHEGTHVMWTDLASGNGLLWNPWPRMPKASRVFAAMPVLLHLKSALENLGQSGITTAGR